MCLHHVRQSCHTVRHTIMMMKLYAKHACWSWDRHKLSVYCTIPICVCFKYTHVAFQTLLIGVKKYNYLIWVLHWLRTKVEYKKVCCLSTLNCHWVSSLERTLRTSWWSGNKVLWFFMLGRFLYWGCRNVCNLHWVMSHKSFVNPGV